MKPRFVLNFLTAGRKKHSAGFALPLVIMGGLVITVAAAAIVMKGMNDQNQVTAQKAKNSSREASETGIERIKATMVSSPAARYMALYNSSQWNNLLNNDGSVNSGTNAALATTLTNHLTELAKQTKAFTCTGDTAAAMTELQGKLVPFKNTVTQASLSIQSDLSYRLVSYEYSGTQGVLSTTPQNGTLTIEGFSSTGAGGSATRLRVEIPISSNPSQRQELGPTIPGLWMKEQGLANGPEPTPPFSSNALGNQRYDADVVFNDCTNIINQQYLDFVNSKASTSPILVGDKQAYKASFPMPDIPTQPAIPSAQILNGISNSMTLPRITDTATDGTYYYRVNGNINLNGSSTLTITPGQKVVIYLNGNIVRGTNIAHNCASAASGVNCTPSNFRIYGISTVSSPEPELCLNGSDIVNGFILAPNYKAGVNGNGKFVGSLWVKSWGKISNCGSSGNQVVLEQNETWDKLPPELQPMKMSTPALQGITSWQEQEVSQSP
jgi:hypothetical protein